MGHPHLRRDKKSTTEILDFVQNDDWGVETCGTGYDGLTQGVAALRPGGVFQAEAAGPARCRYGLSGPWNECRAG